MAYRYACEPLIFPQATLPDPGPEVPCVSQTFAVRPEVNNTGEAGSVRSYNRTVLNVSAGVVVFPFVSSVARIGTPPTIAKSICRSNGAVGVKVLSSTP